MAKFINLELANKLNKLRLSQDISFENLAAKSGLGVATVKRMLSKGEFGELDSLDRLFIALGITTRLSQLLIDSVPNVEASPYASKPRKRASKNSDKNINSNQQAAVIWPEDQS